MDIKRTMRVITRNLREVDRRQEEARVRGEEIDREMTDLLALAAEMERRLDNDVGPPERL